MLFRSGRFFGFFLIFLGVWQAFGGNLINGLWIIFIGWFLESAAGSQLKVAVLKNLLGGHKVVDAMKRDFPKVSGEATLQELVDKHVLTRGERNFVVNGSDSHSGMVTLDAIQAVPRAAWPTTSAFQAMVPLQKLAATNSEAMLWPVLEQMGRDGVNQLPVVDGNRIVGILSRDDILHYLRVQQMFSDKSHNPPSDHM